PIAKEIFDAAMPNANQIDRKRDDVNITAADLLRVPEGAITEKGVRQNINVGIQYIEAWLGGLGCVPLYNLMEDAATAEISRTQVWQWVHNPRGILTDGRRVTIGIVRQMIQEELSRIQRERGDERYQKGHFPEATRIFDDLVSKPQLDEFLTLKADPVDGA